MEKVREKGSITDKTLVKSLVKDGYQITTLDVMNPDEGARANEVKQKYNAQCGTPLFLDAAKGLGANEPELRFCNIREKAGWCAEKPGNASTNLTAKGGIAQASGATGAAATLTFTNPQAASKILTIELQGLSFDEHSTSGLEPVEVIMQELPFKALSAKITQV